MVPSQNVNIENMVKFGGFVPHDDTINSSNWMVWKRIPWVSSLRQSAQAPTTNPW